MFRLKPAAWQRPRHRPSGIPSSVTFLCFWTSEEREVAPDTFEALCPYEEVPDSIDLEETAWEDDGARDLARSLHEGGAFEGLDAGLSEGLLRATRIVDVTVTTADPADLGYLQAAWAKVAYWVQAGAVAVKDLDAQRWWLADEVLALDPHRRFSPRKEVTLGRREVEGGVVEHVTQGMGKLGLPELLLTSPDDDDAIAWATYWLERAIELGAEGEPFAEDDEYFVEGVWLRFASTRREERLPEVRVLEVARRSAKEPLAERGAIPGWFREFVVLDGQAAIGVSDLELRYLTPPTDLSRDVLTVTTSLSPREVFERLRSALVSRKYKLLEAREPKQDVVLVWFEHRPGLFGRRDPEAPRGVSFVAARPDAFPEGAPLVELKARVGPGRTLALFAFLD